MKAGDFVWWYGAPTMLERPVWSRAFINSTAADTYNITILTQDGRYVPAYGQRPPQISFNPHRPQQEYSDELVQKFVDDHRVVRAIGGIADIRSPEG